MADKVEYVGTRINGKPSVYKICDGRNEFLDPRLDIGNHSPDGFEWGYAGSGPAQLALAILADALQDDDRAERLYQQFQISVIMAIERESSWSMTRLYVFASALVIEEAQHAAISARR